MSGRSSNTIDWRGKARALLWPSPYYRYRDGFAAERERLAVLEKALGVPDDSERALLERCMRDAQDAHVPRELMSAAGPGSEPAVDIVSRHPLTGEIDARYRRDEFYAEERRRLDGVQAPSDSEAYSELWYRVMRADRFPGSEVIADHAVQAHRSLCAALYGARAGGEQAALLYLHVGPVQSYIETSRRTHDFWMASFTVGYLTFHGAQALARALGPDAVIMPDLASLPLAEKLLFGKDVERVRLLHSSLANNVLAVVPLGQADRLAGEAARAIQETWQAMGEAAHAHIAGVMRDAWSGWDALWEEQIAAHLDVETVIQPWPETHGELVRLFEALPVEPRPRWLDATSAASDADRTGMAYGALFDLCHRVRAASSRNVPPALVPGDQRPKCSQTGAHEQMGPVAGKAREQFNKSWEFFETLAKNLQRKDRKPGESEQLEDTQPGESEREGPGYSFQLTRGEGLSAVALTKRLAPMVFFGTDKAGLGLDWENRDDRVFLRFPAVVTIAAAPLLYCLHNHNWRRMLPARLEGDERAQREAAIEKAFFEHFDRWLNGLRQLHRNDSLEFTPPGNLLPGLGSLGRSDRLLRNDGQWLHESTYVASTAWQNRYHAQPRDGGDRKRLKEIETQLATPAEAFRKLCKALGMKASPYYALIMLDGDQMGKWLTGRHDATPRLDDVIDPFVRAGLGQDDTARGQLAQTRPLHPALHGELSHRLGKLAQALYDVVETQHLGRVVYSGGDDVLAFVPLATALPCLRAIEREMRKPEHLGSKVTASAGLAIVHMRSPMSRAIDLARKAEKRAKDSGRDRFAVSADRRSGETLEVTLPWRIGGLDVIESFMELGTGGEEDGRDEERLDAAYQLGQELPVLASLPRKAIVMRVKMLLAGEQGRQPASTPLVRAMLEEEIALEEVINVLLLHRFLRREEHGIETLALLAAIQEGSWPRD